MVEFDVLLPRVMQYAQAVPEPLAIQHLRDAAIKLCEDTRCWRDVYTTQTTGDEIEVTSVPPYAALYSIEWARFDGQLLEARAPTSDLVIGEEGVPRFITQLTPNTVTLVPFGVGSLQLSCFLKPSLNADIIPDFLYTEFGPAIADGALSTLLLIPNQPYSNPQQAIYHGQRFQAVLDKNFAYNLRGQQRAAKRTKSSFF